MRIYVDIDETICNTPEDRNYLESVPIYKRIRRINELHNRGHEIFYWTARGSSRPDDKERIETLTKLTKEQLDSWGVKYTDVFLGKRNYDLFICDKVINTEDFFKYEDIKNL
jgi:hypothetical protein